VYAYSANGSLDSFLRDDFKRARLTGSIRLSIMFDLIGVIPFLHTGGCKGYKLIHSDIQCATIWLSDDFKAQLMCCGLSKLLHNISNASTKKSSSSRANTSSSPFGTRRYMCPESFNNPDLVEYEAAYDVYSIGIVLVQLVLGQLIDDCDCDSSSSKDGSEFLDMLKFTNNSQVMKAFEWLKEHADRSIVWDPANLNVICRVVMACLAASHPYWEGGPNRGRRA
jgi:serine/threonine protein kinase